MPNNLLLKNDILLKGILHYEGQLYYLEILSLPTKYQN